jgi:predicted phage terminase large subunit-like protein
MTVTDLLKRAALSRPLLAEHLATDFGAFVRAAWRVVHPGRTLHWNWSYDLLCEHLMLVRQRKILRLIWNCPPRSAKTTVASIMFPDWVWLTDPAHRFLAASYEMSLSKDHNSQRRNLIGSDWYQQLFGDRFSLAGDRNLAEQFANDHQGEMTATSIDARAMGRGGDTIILDDVITQDQALSDLTRKSVNDWLGHTMYQRLNDPAESAIVLIMQRVHENDPTGYFLETEPGVWTHIKLQLIAQEDERWVLPISGRVIERKRGECLHPKRFPAKVVEQKKRDRFTFAGQFQQEPAPLEGNLIRRSDVRFYGGNDPLTNARDEDLPVRFDQKIISVDCSFKDLSTSDYVSVLVLGISGRKRYVLSVTNSHLDCTATENEIRRQREIHGPISAVLVEDKANGTAVIQRLRANVPGVVEIEPQGGKAARMAAASPEWQAGDWYVCRNAPWCEPFLQQLLMFPAGRHDDMCDAMSQAAVWLQSRSWASSWPVLMAREAKKNQQPKDAPLELGRAQKLEALKMQNVPSVFGQERGSGYRAKTVEGELAKRQAKALPVKTCPHCGNTALGRCGDYAYCSCGWNNRQQPEPPTPNSEPVGIQSRNQRIWPI